MKCHVCDRERPDAQIGVVRFKATTAPISIQFNIRCCIDNHECLAGAEAKAVKWNHGEPVRPL